MSRQYHLSGQTLIEVLTSLAILSLVFVMGMMLFQRLSGIQSPPERLQTRMMVAAFLDEPIHPSEFFTEKDIRGRLLHRTIRPIDQRRQVYQVRVQAYWGKTLLEDRKKVVKLYPSFQSKVLEIIERPTQPIVQ